MNTNQGISRTAKPHFDWTLTILTFLLAFYGVVAVTVATYSYSDAATVSQSPLGRIITSNYGSRQGLFLLVSPLVIAAMIMFNYRIFRKLAMPLYIASLVLLLMVLVLGNTTSGVTGWFNLFAGYMLQPSEFAKVAAIILLAKFFARKDNPVSTVREFITMAIYMMIPVMLIFAQGELGTVMVLVAIYIGMMFMSGMRLRIIVGLLLGGVTALIPIVLYLRESGSYRYERLISFIDPSQASPDAIYQARNSQIAIGNGGLTGVGLFKDGTYSALNYVPQDHTDFIFSSIGETMGFMGCMLVLVLYALLLLRLVVLARNTYDKFAQLVIIGVFTMLFFHVFYNIGMAIGLTPVMGIPLPFLSYGGSNLTANMAGIGLVLNITLRKPTIRSTQMEEGPSGSPMPRTQPRASKRRRRFREKQA